jgi:hypothetical protein
MHVCIVIIYYAVIKIYYYEADIRRMLLREQHYCESILFIKSLPSISFVKLINICKVVATSIYI